MWLLITLSKIMSKSNYNNYYEDDWGRGPRTKKDKPGKKHNNKFNNIDYRDNKNNWMTNKSKPVKSPKPFKRHGDDDEDE